MKILLKNNIKKAFSLIELSVVILIIGILIGGVSQGVDLYKDFIKQNALKITKNSVVNRISDLSMWLDYSNPNSYVSYKNKFPGENQGVGQILDSNPQKISNFRGVGHIFCSDCIGNLSATRGFGIYGVTGISLDRLADLISKDGYSWFMVLYIDDPGGYNWGGVFGVKSSNGDYAFGHHYQNEGYEQYYLGNNVSFGTNWKDFRYSPKKPYIATYVNKVSGAMARVNRSLDQTNTNTDLALLSSNLNQSFSLTFGVYYGGYYFQGGIGELIVFSRALSPKEVFNVEDYLSKKWSIPLIRKTL
jgi:prepilin-type N-terminal cleavage/methylation domain-containing protein